MSSSHPEQDSSNPPARREEERAPDRRQEEYSAHPQFTPNAVAPEFLNLNYTLPYHLVARVDEIARESYRSQSEVLAAALRVYLKAWTAKRKHTRITTVDGFSYQEVEIADVVVEDEADLGVHPDQNGADGATTSPSTEPATAQAAEPAEQTEPSEPTEPTEKPPPEETAAELGGQGQEHASTTDGPERTDSEETAAEPAAREPTEEARADDGGKTAEARAVAASDEDGETDESDEAVRVSETVATATATEQDGELDDGRDDAEEPEADAKNDRKLPEFADPAAGVRLQLEAVADAKLHSQKLRRALEEIAAKIDVKDHSPADHSTTVAEMAKELAQEMDLGRQSMVYIQLAALTHDIGKASIPDHILTKRRPTPEEMTTIRKYPEFGTELLRIVPALEPVVPIVAACQERWNGNGYPDGLQGSDIPIEAQIIAICDVYRVLITERHYRPAYSEERARQIVRQNLGTLWNPELGRTFLKMIGGEEQEAA